MKIIGDYPDIQRVLTGFHSLDTALNNANQGTFGAPLTIYEVYGYEGVGKSTFTMSLASILAASINKNIAISPIEELDKTLMEAVMSSQGFSGDVLICLGQDNKDKSKQNDEKALDDLIAHLSDESIGVGILDSIGAISPVAELEADSVADVNMGRRAMLMAKLYRVILHVQRFRDTPLTFIGISHIHQIIGGRGTDTSGGGVKKFLSKVRIRLKRKEEFEADGSYVLEGKIEKLSFGQSGRTFQVFCLAGRGLHRGLSAIIDCENLELSKREKGVVKMNGQSYGRLSKIIEGADTFDFTPFYEALRGEIDTVSTEDEDSEDEGHLTKDNVQVVL